MRLRWYYCCSVGVLPPSRAPAYCYVPRYGESADRADRRRVVLPEGHRIKRRNMVAARRYYGRDDKRIPPSTGTSENRQQERNPHITQTRRGHGTVIRSNDFQKLILVS